MKAADLPGDRKLFSFRLAARVLGMSRATLHRVHEDGGLAVIQVGRRRLIPRSEVLRLLGRK